MEKKLTGRKVAILITDGFEESEFTRPLKALKECDAHVDVVSPGKGRVRSWSGGNWSNEYQVDKTLDEVTADDYDALVLPGGVMNPDKLRMDSRAVEFAAAFMAGYKPVAAICHGPWLLIETRMLGGRMLTSYASLKTDLENAGASWVDRGVVVDRGLVTSRDPDDLPAFCKKLIEEVHEGIHQPH